MTCAATEPRHLLTENFFESAGVTHAMRFGSIPAAVVCVLCAAIAHAGELTADSLHAATSTATTQAPFQAQATEASLDASRPSLFSRREVWLGLATVGTVALVATQDQWLTAESLESRSQAQQSVADAVRPLGTGGLVFSALALGYVGARFTGHPETASQFARVGASVAFAGLFTSALKEVVGRARPAETPGDADELHPFSGYSSFPSGHTTVAFALAAAVDAETESRWVPWIAY